MSNHLKHETSPYLLQHADNPVDWYPWCEEAFRRAKAEDKPVFLSIGYSTCHWCHVMAHESFEDPDIAGLLNRYFISVKVDKEERPDIDSIYMTVCQAYTGSGGWPTSIFMTADQKPFFAGTYFPRDGRGGMIGLRELLIAIHQRWMDDRSALLRQAEHVVSQLKNLPAERLPADTQLPDLAVALFKRLYDPQNGGFGQAPKFPTPHNLLFLLAHYRRYGDPDCLKMAEHTLRQMYRGGLFDHIGYGFCRYSTDRRFLAPHFEKMLYDNALLILAYTSAFSVTKEPFYLRVAQNTADFILREMTSAEGGFYSAQDADSDGEEGKFYLFTPDEITGLLGEKDGQAFNRHFDITRAGNFEGKNIPNLLKSDPGDRSFDRFLPQLADYRKSRCSLHLDDKILTLWNSLMIAALCWLYRACGDSRYLAAAQKADCLIRQNLCQNETLYVSWRSGKQGVKGFLDDYAGYIFAQLALYQATLDRKTLDRAGRFCQKALTDFWDEQNGGFYLYGADHEGLILRPKETYDGAIPSGNSLMAWNLVGLHHLTNNPVYAEAAQRQLDFLAGDATSYPPGHAMALLAMLDQFDPPPKLTVVLKNQADQKKLVRSLPPEIITILIDRPTPEYPLKNDRTTFYLCHGHSCLPPVNDLNELPITKSFERS